MQKQKKRKFVNGSSWSSDAAHRVRSALIAMSFELYGIQK